MTTIAFEIELTLDGTLTRYHPATWMQPAEGGTVEDLEIRDAGVISVKPEAQRRHAQDRWLTTSFLKGVDRKNPEVQRLLDNLLELVREQAEEAIIEDADDGCDWEAA